MKLKKFNHWWNCLHARVSLRKNTCIQQGSEYIMWLVSSFLKKNCADNHGQNIKTYRAHFKIPQWPDWIWWDFDLEVDAPIKLLNKNGIISRWVLINIMPAPKYLRHKWPSRTRRCFSLHNDKAHKSQREEWGQVYYIYIYNIYTPCTYT